MKKGVMMEKHRNYTVILTRDGTFQKGIVTDKKANIGEEVQFEPYLKRSFFNLDRKNKRPYALKLGSVAVLIAVFIFSSFYFVGGSKTYAYITVDINPSMEIEINQLLQVQNITAINADAKMLLSDLTSYKDEDLHSIIEEIMNKSENENMVNDAKNMLIGVSYVEEPEKKVQSKINQYFSKQSDWQVITFNVPPEVRQIAVENRSSMNKELDILINDKNYFIESQINLDEIKKELIHSFYNKKSEPKPEQDMEKIDLETKLEIKQMDNHSSDVEIIDSPGKP